MKRIEGRTLVEKFTYSKQISKIPKFFLALETDAYKWQTLKGDTFLKFINKINKSNRIQITPFQKMSTLKVCQSDNYPTNFFSLSLSKVH